MGNDLREEDVEEVVEDTATEEPEGAEPVAEDPEAEAEARRYGWKPKDEFGLDQKGWVDAKRFLELPATLRKIQRDEARDLREQVARQNETLARMEQANRAAIERARKQEQERYEAELARIRKEQRAAAEMADVRTFDALQEQAAKLKAPEPIQPQPQAPQVSEDDQRVLREYAEKNPWITVPGMQQEAFNVVQAALDRGVALRNAAEQLAFAETAIRQKYGFMFPAEQKASPSASRVDSGGLGGSAPRMKPLPPEARAVARDLISEGIYKTEAEYAADYWKELEGKR